MCVCVFCVQAQNRQIWMMCYSDSIEEFTLLKLKGQGHRKDAQRQPPTPQ